MIQTAANSTRNSPPTGWRKKSAKPPAGAKAEKKEKLGPVARILRFYASPLALYTIPEAADAVGVAESAIARYAEPEVMRDHGGKIPRRHLEDLALWYFWPQPDIDAALRVLNLPASHPLSFYCTEEIRFRARRYLAVRVDAGGEEAQNHLRDSVHQFYDADESKLPPGYAEYEDFRSDLDAELQERAAAAHATIASHADQIAAMAKFFASTRETFTPAEVAPLYGVSVDEATEEVRVTICDDTVTVSTEVSRNQIEWVGRENFWTSSLIDEAIRALPPSHPRRLEELEAVTVRIPRCLAAAIRALTTNRGDGDIDYVAVELLMGFYMREDEREIAERELPGSVQALERLGEIIGLEIG